MVDVQLAAPADACILTHALHAVLPAALQLVAATVQLFNAICCELLPTPSKSHYTFNLRDMGKVVQGLMRADPKATASQQQVGAMWAREPCGFEPWTIPHRSCVLFAAPVLQVLALWLHETCRVFEDRLTCPEDQGWFR
jgi:dynein heavy chain